MEVQREMMMKIKKALKSLLIAGMLLSGAAQATPVTWTFSGIINEGFDEAGFFGSPYTSLNGLSYVETITTDPELNGNHIESTTQHYSFSWNTLGDLAAADFIYSLTINGLTFSVDVTNPTQNLISLTSVTQPADAPVQIYDTIYQRVIGSDDFGQTLNIERAALSYNREVVESLDFNQVASFAGPFSGESYNYSWTGGDRGYAHILYATITGISLNGAPLPVSGNGTNQIPEPASLALLGIALAGIGVTRRKKTV